MMEEYPPINVRLAVNRVDLDIIKNEGIQPRIYTPGEEISSQPDFLRYINLINVRREEKDSFAILILLEDMGHTWMMKTHYAHL